MTTRRALIAIPAIVTLLLIQAYFWVPTYEEQTRGNPERLHQFITASIGDASILNPILSADSASSQIQDKIFEGLIDRDEELRYRGRLARRWRITEDAYFHVNRSRPVKGAGDLSPAALKNWLQERFQENPRGWGHIRQIELLPPSLETTSKSIDTPDGRHTTYRVTIHRPARMHMMLDRVDPELFNRLSGLLGAGYFKGFDPDPLISVTPDVPDDIRHRWAAELVPTTIHNPVIDFFLRPGVRFHDGHVFDAEDVKFTYASIMNPRNLSPRAPDFEPVKSVTVVDPLTVRVTYKRLYSPALGTWAMGILPEHLLNADSLKQEAESLGKDPADFTMRQSRFNRHPVGCGPFVFKEWKADQYIRLKRFDDYWEGPPNYRTYVMRVIPNVLTQEMEFYAGTVDDYTVAPHQVQRLSQDDRFQRFSGTSFGYTYIGYNMRRKPFDDVRVRKALGMAIDRDRIIRYVLYGQAEPITGPFVKQTDYYNHDINPLPYDPQGALRLLAEAGWHRNADGWLEKDGKRMQFTLITNNGNNLRKAILAIAQDAWKKIGIDVSTDLIEWSVFIQNRVNQLDFDALVLGWSMGIDPDLYQIWHSSQTGPYQLNFVGFSDPEADKLILRIRREYDHDKQVADCHRLHEIIAEAQPYTFLYVGRWTALLDKRIVRRATDDHGREVIRPIVATKTGSYSYHFNQWVKLPQAPTFSAGE